MPDPQLMPRAAFAGLDRPGRQGSPEGEAGVTVAPRNAYALASVLAHKGRIEALARRVSEVYGINLPREPRRASAGPTAFVWSGPGQWLAVTEGVGGPAFEGRLRERLPGLASVSDQSDGRAVIRISGPRARDMLAKGLPIDLHPRAFAPGHAAVTLAAHVGVHIWQLDAVPTYEIAVFRSYAASFWDWLMEAGAESGIDVEAG